MKKILWKEFEIVLQVEEEEHTRRQHKFYGKVLEAKDPAFIGIQAETGYLKKSEYKIINNRL